MPKPLAVINDPLVFNYVRRKCRQLSSKRGKERLTPPVLQAFINEHVLPKIAADDYAAFGNIDDADDDVKHEPNAQLRYYKTAETGELSQEPRSLPFGFVTQNRKRRQTVEEEALLGSEPPPKEARLHRDIKSVNVQLVICTNVHI